MTDNIVVVYVNHFYNGRDSFDAVGVLTLTDEETKEYVEYVKNHAEDNKLYVKNVYEYISPFVGESKNDIWKRIKYLRAIPEEYEMDEEELCFITFWNGYKKLDVVEPEEEDWSIKNEWHQSMKEHGYYIHPDFVYVCPELSIDLMKLLREIR